MRLVQAHSEVNVQNFGRNSGLVVIIYFSFFRQFHKFSEKVSTRVSGKQVKMLRI